MPHAVIDIGTNTVILLIAKTRGKKVEVVLDRAVITRLGQGLTENHFFSADAMKRTRTVLADFAQQCHKYKVDKIVAVGTAACRTAANAEVFIGAVKKECGLKIDVITGEKEAEYEFLAAYQDFGAKHKNILVVDIGGGSTEIITGPGDAKKIAPRALISLPLGSVRLTEQFVRSDPILSEEFHRLHLSVVNGLKDELDTFFPEDFNPADFELIATAGTATTLAALSLKLKTYKPEKVHGYALKQESLEKLLAELAIRSVRERQQLPGIEPLRADVILAGGIVLNEIIKYFKKDQALISDRGLRYGVFYKKFLK